ncbi:MAG: helix-turn-helix domain-containing protein [Candidatus Hodarchaeales archaeon]
MVSPFIPLSDQLGHYLDLSSRESNVLGLIFNSGKITAKELSINLEVDLPRIYDVLSTLEDKDLIKKEEGRPAIYIISSTIIQTVIEYMIKAEEDYKQKISEANTLLKEMTVVMNLNDNKDVPSDFIESIELLTKPFTHLFTLTSPDQILEYYEKYMGRSLELNIVSSSSQFTNAFQRFFHLESPLQERMIHSVDKTRYFRVINIGKLDFKTVKQMYVNNQKNQESSQEEIALKGKVIEIRESTWQDVKILFGHTNEAVIFPILRPDESIMAILCSKDWKLLDNYRNYFWKHWNDLEPKYVINRGNFSKFD